MLENLTRRLVITFVLSPFRRVRICKGFATMTGTPSASEGPSNAIEATNSVLKTDSSCEITTHNLSTTQADNNGRALNTNASNSGRCESQHDQTSPQSVETSGLPRKGHVRRVKEGRETTKFQLLNSAVLVLQRGDITKWSMDGQTDAIVNAANTRMLGGGGVDGAIHRAAGSDLYQACLKLPLVGKNVRCRTGDAVITEGFRLPVSKIVHTVGPVYDSADESGPLLESSYKSSLLLAVNSGIKFLAFPSISCGIYGYPYDEAAEIALKTVGEHSTGLKEVHFVLFEEGSWVEWLDKACKSFERLEQEL